MDKKDRVISFDNEFADLHTSINNTQKKANAVEESFAETDAMLRELRLELGALIDNCPAEASIPSDTSDTALDELNKTVTDIIALAEDKSKLNAADVVVGISAGLLAAVIDIIFVGAPEVVKIYKGGENFDGSILTAAFRKVGNDDGKLSEMLEWLCGKCKVAYDIPIVKDTANPNNHRLRNFAHDPLLGALFAVVDIVMGTATFVDNNGKLRVVVNDRTYPDSEKILSLVYYLGHLLSDVCTARGLPIPGFALTQFFATGEDSSLAHICEQMYKDGYDLRHLASMSVPVAVKNLIIEAYIRVFRSEELCGITTIAQKQIIENQKQGLKYKLLLVSDGMACAGNVFKFFLPPTGGNPTALNLSEWISLLNNSIATLKYQHRDKDVEMAIAARAAINQNWSALKNT